MQGQFDPLKVSSQCVLQAGGSVHDLLKGAVKMDSTGSLLLLDNFESNLAIVEGHHVFAVTGRILVPLGLLAERLLTLLGDNEEQLRTDWPGAFNALEVRVGMMHTL